MAFTDEIAALLKAERNKVFVDHRDIDKDRVDNIPKNSMFRRRTGLPNLLRGLKLYSDNITAIVTVADDGGSSGVIRNELKYPPGDIRNCLLALANTEPFMEKLFQYRFTNGSLKGHSFGNLFIAAMTEMLGNFELAIKESSKVLAVRGTVLPSTLEDVILEATYEDGEKAYGESHIPICGKRISRVTIKPSNAKPLRSPLKL